MILFWAISIGKLVAAILKLRGSRGTALPGLIVEKFVPDFLQKIRPQLGTVIMITGTNGKTSTQTLLAHVIKQVYTPSVLVNSRGANLQRGLIAEIVKQIDIGARKHWNYSIFEIEEATFPKVAVALKPDFIIVTNFFRDQLDAYGEINRTKQHVRAAILSAPEATVIANQDDPQIVDMLTGLTNKVIAISIKQHEKFIEYEKLDQETGLAQNKSPLNELNKSGKFQPHKLIEFPLPKLTENLSPEFFWSEQKFSLQLPGFHSFYAFALTFALLTQLDQDSGAKAAAIAQAAASCKPAFGRGEIVHYTKSDQALALQIFLVKNPVGFDLTLDLFANSNKPLNLVILINDLIADGKDVSWLWDSRLEKLAKIKINRIYLAGSRALDMQLRIKYALNLDNVRVFNNYSELVSALIADKAENNKVISTYTAMNQFRDLLLGID